MKNKDDYLFALLLILTVFSGADGRWPIFTACMAYWIVKIFCESRSVQVNEQIEKDFKKLQSEVNLLKAQLSLKKQ